MLHKASTLARQNRIPVVWSTHGMTAPWSLHHKWWKKCLPWYLYQKRDLSRAALIHCTTDLEAGWNHALGFEYTCVVPLGTILPDKKQGTSAVDLACHAEAQRRQDLRPRLKTLLFVGRIYPVKALDNLIKAYSRALKSQTPTTSPLTPDSCVPWTLRLVGPDQAGHMAELMSLCDSLSLPYSTPQQNSDTSTVDLRPGSSPLVEFVGPKFGADLSTEYENCDALALVSHTENFGATVVDALAYGKPVITSTHTPWSIVHGNSNISSRCGWWVDNDVETLAATLNHLFGLSAGQLVDMGENGRKLVGDHFSWIAVAKKTVKVYEEVV